MESLLNNGRHESGELRLLPPLLVRQLDMDKVQAFERVRLFDTAEQVNPALPAGVSENDCRVVDDAELVSVGRDLDLVSGDNADDREEGAGGLPAFGASAGVVVGDVAPECDLHRPALAVAAELAPGEVGVPFGQTIIDQWMKRRRHGEYAE